MDKRKLVYNNKKVLKEIEERNKNVGEEKANRIVDEESVVLKDSVNYLGRKIPKNLKDAENKIQEVIDYHKPRWVSNNNITGKMFFISSNKKEKSVKYDINKFYRRLFGIK